jgi:hypothetical protein
MSFGIYAINDNNKLLINGDGVNLVYRGKATIYQTNLTPGFTVAFTVTQVFRFTCEENIAIFTHTTSSNYYALLECYKINSNTWEIAVETYNTYANMGLTLYCFSAPPTQTLDTGWGINLYTSAGTAGISFSSKLNHLVPVLGLNTEIPEAIDPVPPPINTYAVSSSIVKPAFLWFATNLNVWEFRFSNVNAFVFYVPAIRFISNTLQITWLDFGRIPGGSNSGNLNPQAARPNYTLVISGADYD